MSEPSVNHRIAEEATGYDPFQALRLMLLCRQDQQAEPGYDAPPDTEALRLRASISHNFAASSVERVDPNAAPRPDADARPEVVLNFMGVFGPSGVLPRQYTDRLTRSGEQPSETLQAFLDLFNHRALSYFYRAWRKHQFPVEYERAAAESAVTGADPVSEALRSLVGFERPPLRNRLSFSDDVPLWFAGHFANRTPKADALANMVRYCLRAPIEFKSLAGQWAELAPADRTTLRRPGSTRRSVGLGGGMTLGKRVWLVESRFRLRIGPLRLQDFQALSPGGVQLRRLAELIRVYAGAHWDFDIQLVLLGREAPRPKLERAPQRRLGVDTWLLTQHTTANLDDAVFRPSGWPERRTGA